MSPEFSINFIRPHECGQLLGLIRGLARYQRIPDRVVTDARGLEAELFCENPAVRCLVVRRGGELVGYAAYFLHFSTFSASRLLYIEDIYLDGQVRRCGIGRALMRRLAREAQAQKCRSLVWTVLDWNAPALAFYGSLGAEMDPDWRVCSLGGDALEALARE